MFEDEGLSDALTLKRVEDELASYREKNKEAMNLIIRYGGIDGGHHKAWVLDQVMRVLAGDQYDEIVRKACEGVDGPNTYSWDVGIAP